MKYFQKLRESNRQKRADYQFEQMLARYEKECSPMRIIQEADPKPADHRCASCRLTFTNTETEVSD